MIKVYQAVETGFVGNEVYPRRVKKGELIGDFSSIMDLYKHLCSQLSVDGPRGLEALWGERGYIRVSLYDGEDFAQDAAGRRISRFCS